MSLNVIFDNGTHKIETAGVLPDKSYKERAWRADELARTDELVKLPDYPVDLIPYRQALRDYPSQLGFPNCGRPVL